MDQVAETLEYIGFLLLIIAVMLSGLGAAVVRKAGDKSLAVVMSLLGVLAILGMIIHEFW